MQPLLLTDNDGKDILVDGDAITSAWWMESSTFPEAKVRIVFQNLSTCNVRESPKEIAEMIKK